MLSYILGFVRSTSSQNTLSARYNDLNRSETSGRRSMRCGLYILAAHLTSTHGYYRRPKINTSSRRKSWMNSCTPWRASDHRILPYCLSVGFLISPNELGLPICSSLPFSLLLYNVHSSMSIHFHIYEISNANVDACFQHRLQNKLDHELLWCMAL